MWSHRIFRLERNSGGLECHKRKVAFFVFISLNFYQTKADTLFPQWESFSLCCFGLSLRIHLPAYNGNRWSDAFLVGAHMPPHPHNRHLYSFEKNLKRAVVELISLKIDFCLICWEESFYPFFEYLKL